MDCTAKLEKMATRLWIFYDADQSVCRSDIVDICGHLPKAEKILAYEKITTGTISDGSKVCATALLEFALLMRRRLMSEPHKIDKMDAMRLDCAIMCFRAADLQIEPKRYFPFVDCRTPAEFCEAVEKVFSKLPRDVQKIVAEKAYFTQVGQNILGTCFNATTVYPIVIDSKLTGQKLLHVIAHEICHAVIFHKGLRQSEQAADAMAAEWGFPETQTK